MQASTERYFKPDESRGVRSKLSLVHRFLLAFFLEICTYRERRRRSDTGGKISLGSIVQTLKVAVRLASTRNMLLLVIPFA